MMYSIKIALLRFVMLIFLLVTSLALPTPVIDEELAWTSKLDDNERNVYQEGPYFEGDIRIHPTKNGVINPVSRWPDAVIPYVIAPGFSSSDEALIQKAINDYSALTCVRWVRRTTQYDYVNITRVNSGCWSYVGRIGGRQNLNIQTPGCNYKGSIIHEMMHAAGFWHEQSRADRDDYVQVNLENIMPGKESNFNKLTSSISSTFGVNYDYGSVMHYSAYAFSSNNQPTLTPKKPLNGAVMGQNTGFALSDYWRINRMYSCDGYNSGP